MPWVCKIYKNRPEFCRRYPKPESFIPQSCGFHFPGDGTRRGRCEPACEASCCKLPRMNGDPDGAALPEAAGGLPCKHLDYTDDDVKFAEEEITKMDGVPRQQADTAVAEE